MVTWSVTSRALPATMTSLTDHSVESILRHSDNNRPIGHVVNTSQQYGGDGYMSATGGPETVFVDRSPIQVRNKPHLELEHPDLWNQFYRQCTEMVITKSGRSVCQQHQNAAFFLFLLLLASTAAYDTPVLRHTCVVYCCHFYLDKTRTNTG